MKFIFSRKGFDAENGGTASPVMPDGALVSLPIPSYDRMKFDDIAYNGRTYMDIWQELKPNQFGFAECCHLDPDLRNDGKLEKVDSSIWKPAFGQAEAAQTHLKNQGLGVGDVFLFFGWFRQTEEIDGELRYKKGAKDAHMLYGYLQVGEIVTGDGFEKYPWHPHAEQYFNGYDDNNTLYVASDKLIIDGVDTGLPGAGTFKYSEEIVLTMPGQTKSRWKLPEFFKNVNISCHNADSFKPEGYFQTVRIGQEFVISESSDVTEWAKNIIVNNYDDRSIEAFPESIKKMKEKMEKIREQEEAEYAKRVNEIANSGADNSVLASVEVRICNELIIESRMFPVSQETYVEYIINSEDGEIIPMTDAEDYIIGEIYEIYEEVSEDFDWDDEEDRIKVELFAVAISDPNLLKYLSDLCVGHKVIEINSLLKVGEDIYIYDFEYEFSKNTIAKGIVELKIVGGVIAEIIDVRSETETNNGTIELVPHAYSFEGPLSEIID